MKRLYTLDIFRIACCLFVFLFHVKIGLKINFLFLNRFMELSHIFMVAFFMLSGFSLYYVDWAKKQFEIDNEYRGGYTCVAKFYKKRLISIYPLYIVTYLLYVLIYVVILQVLPKNEFVLANINSRLTDFSIIKNILILPVELSLFQTVYSESFLILHNGGTWFISCIWICYLLYPFASRFIYNNKQYRFLLLVFLYLICSYSDFIRYIFDFGDWFSVYVNPFFRFMEFFIGIIIASLCLDTIKKKVNKSRIVLIISLFLVFIVLLSIGHYCGIGSTKVGVYNFLAIPAFGYILYSLVRVEFSYPITKYTRIIHFLSENTYAFFLAQLFASFPLNYLDNCTSIFHNYRSIKLLVASFTLCTFVTLFLHYGIEKPVKNKIIIK